MGIFRRKDSPYWWYRIQLDHRVVSGSTRVRDKRLAEKIYLEKRHQAVEEDHFPGLKGRRVPFPQMCRMFMEKYSKASKRSWYSDQSTIRRLNAFFGNCTLASITPQKVEEYKASRKGFVKEATINRELACLKTIFSKAVEWGYVRDNPVKRVRFFREELKPIRILTASEKERMLSEAPEFLRPILLTALKTGMRKGEILNLRWSEVDLARQTISVRRTKGKRLRQIPIHPQLAELMKSLPRRSEYVFPGPDGKKLVQGGYVRGAFESLVRTMGLGDFTFHDLRHNFASELMEKGADPRTIQEYLGHSTLALVQRYTHVKESTWRSTIQLLSREKGVQNTTLTLRWSSDQAPNLPESAENFSERAGGGMADATDLKSVGRKAVWVRFPPRLLFWEGIEADPSACGAGGSEGGRLRRRSGATGEEDSHPAY